MRSFVADSVIADIPGWFFSADILLFRFILSHQVDDGQLGDLVEMGVYQGRSAVLIGSYLQTDETFTVVDLFEDGQSTDGANARENVASYEGFTRRVFEKNYTDVHGTLPRVVQGLSSSIGEVARTGQHRFVHIDASHLYDHVRSDIAMANELLKPNGIVVLDDFRSEHTPGVAAAAWEAVAAGMHPIALSSTKLYGTWGDVTPWLRSISQWLPSSGLEYETQSVAKNELFRVWFPPRPAARWLPPVAVKPALQVRRHVRSWLMRSGSHLSRRTP
jgi:predicted O-methyltransferase YrrM